MTSISRTVKIGDTDISSYVEWGPHRTKGAGRRAKTSPIIGGNRAVVWQEGRDPLTLEAGLIFRPDLADQIGDEDEITALIDDLAGDQETDRLYFGRSDRFAVVHGSVGDTEITPAAGGAGIIRKTAEFWAEAAELYGATPTAWDDEGALPLTSAAIENAGNLDAGLFVMEVVGKTTALKLDGIDDWIDAGAVDLSGDELTFEMWVQVLTPGVFLPRLLQYGGYNVAGSVNLASTADGSGLRCDIGNPSQSHDFSAYSAGWNHIIFVYDKVGNEIIVYINGGSAESWEPGTAIASVGSHSLYLALFKGACGNIIIARFRCWTRILSAAEAAAAYAGETVSDTDLVIHYDFTEGEGDTLTDLSGEGNDGTLTGFADTDAGAGDEGESGWMSAGGWALESVALELLDDEAEVVASIALSPGLLSAEVLEVDRFGQIRQTYSDDFGSGARFAYDGFKYGTAAVADGALTVGASSYAGYALVGQWPIKRGGLLVTFTPTEAGTGEALLEVSVDGGVSWLEVSNNSRWVDGAENEIYVPQAEGYVEVWIRWRCDDAITSLSIDDLQIVQLRAVSDADVPKIPAGEERVLRVSGTGRATISAEWRDRYRP